MEYYVLTDKRLLIQEKQISVTLLLSFQLTENYNIELQDMLMTFRHEMGF